jgi:hypothetical protein
VSSGALNIYDSELVAFYNQTARTRPRDPKKGLVKKADDKKAHEIFNEPMKTQKSHEFFHIPLHAFKVQTKTSLKSTWNMEKDMENA